MTQRKAPKFIGEDEIAAPTEPLKRVRVNHPHRLAYNGETYTGDTVVVIPGSLASTWLLNQWAEDLD